MAIVITYPHAPIVSGTDEADYLDFSALNGGVITIAGGLGNDTYYGAADIFGIDLQEAAGGGIDTLLFTAPGNAGYVLADNIENLVVLAPAFGFVTYAGNAAANSMVGTGASEGLDGGAGNDTLVGGEGDDQYFVNATGDVARELEDEGTDTVLASVNWTLGSFLENLLLGGASNLNGSGNGLDNSITGNAGNNRLEGGAGNDAIAGGAGNDSLLGGEGNDSLEGGAGLNSLDGGAGDDVLTMGGLRDTLAGGAGDDLYYVNDGGAVTVLEAANAGADRVVSTRASYTLAVNVEALTLDGSAVSGTGNAQSNAIDGNAGDNVLSGLAGNDRLDGRGGQDTLLGGAGNDTMHVDSVNDVVVEAANSGTDTVVIDVGVAPLSYTLGANVENLVLVYALAPSVRGNELNNSITGAIPGGGMLWGLAGNDTLIGQGFVIGYGDGAPDVLIGGIGNDTYVLGNASDFVVEAGASGNDTVRSAYSHTLAVNVENLELTGSGSLSATGNAAANRLTGNAGNNVLDGAGGNDTLAGGLGNDTYVVHSAADSVSDTGGVDRVIVRGTWIAALPAGIENVEIAGPVATPLAGNTLNNVMTGNGLANTLSGAAGDDSLWGGDGADSLSGDAGNDTLDGGRGVDTLAGGAGNDTFHVDSALDVVIEAAGAGTDQVIASVSYSLVDTDGAGAAGGGVERLTLTGAARNGTGNDLNNVIVGNVNANLLAGGLGNDSLAGGFGNDTLGGDAGNDTLEGGDGADSMTGGAGNDTYVVDSAGDVLVEVADASGGSADAVLTALSWTLAPGFEHLAFSSTLYATGLSGTGNASANSIKGGDGDDTLDGAGGNDTMEGGLGNDLYRVDSAADMVVETALANGGNDTIESAVSLALSANLENLVLTGAGNITGTGNARDNQLSGNIGNNTLAGGAGNDTIYGDDANDSLSGDAGDDILVGGDGVDTLVGGAGNDTYGMDGDDAAIVEAANAGTDEVHIVELDFSYTLAANVENLEIEASTGAVRATGNALGNRIVLSDAASVGASIEGGAGNDTMVAETALEDAGGTAFFGGVEGADDGTDRLEVVLDGAYTQLEAHGFEALAVAVAGGGASWNLGNVEDGGGVVRIDLSGAGGFTAAGLAAATSDKFVFGLEAYGQVLTLAIASPGTAMVSVGAETDAAVTGANVAHLVIGVDGAGARLDVTGIGGTSYALDGAGSLDLSGLADASTLDLEDFVSGDLRLEAASTGSLVLQLGGTLAMLELANVNVLVLDTEAAGSGVPSFVRVEGTADELLLIGAGSDFLSVDNYSAELVRAGEDGGPAGFSGVLTFTNHVAGIEFQANAGVVRYASSGAASEVLSFGAGASGIDTGLSGRLDASDSVFDGSFGDGDILYANVSDLGDPLTGGLNITAIETVSLFADQGDVVVDAARITYVTTILVDADGTDSFLLDNANASVDASASSSAVTVYAAGSVTGGAGADFLATTVNGQLDGGLGADTLAGGDSFDYFAFSAALGGGNEDVVLGFVSGQDRIALGGVFAGLDYVSGTLESDHFESNATGVAAVAAGPVIVYNNATGELYYDADGAGGAAGTRFAILDGEDGAAPALSQEDFVQLF